MIDIASIVTLVLPFRSGVWSDTSTSSNLFSTTDKANSMETLVNSDTTSKDTNSKLSGIFEKETNLELLATKELELPTSGDSTRARYLERAYLRNDTNETTGLRGTPGL